VGALGGQHIILGGWDERGPQAWLRRLGIEQIFGWSRRWGDVSTSGNTLPVHACACLSVCLQALVLRVGPEVEGLQRREVRRGGGEVRSAV
jgi:hypothetical protein